METRARYVLIGAFTLVCLFAGFGFVYWIKNLGGFGERALYDIRFEQPVSGLTPGANVLFNGIRAGTVTRIDLDPNEPKPGHRRHLARSGDAGARRYADRHRLSGLHRRRGHRAQRRLAAGAALDAEGRTPAAARRRSPTSAGALTESAQQTLRRVDAILNDNAKPLNTAITGIAAFADMLGRNSERVEGLIGGLEKLAGTGAAKQGPTIYDLAAATSFPPTEKTIKAQLVVPDPSALILFDSQKILIRSDAGTYTNIDNAQWADNLPKLIQARLVQSFENARQLGAVSRPLEQLTAEYRLELAIQQLPGYGGAVAERGCRADGAARRATRARSPPLAFSRPISPPRARRRRTPSRRSTGRSRRWPERSWAGRSARFDGAAAPLPAAVVNAIAGRRQIGGIQRGIDCSDISGACIAFAGLVHRNDARLTMHMICSWH